MNSLTALKINSKYMGVDNEALYYLAFASLALWFGYIFHVRTLIQAFENNSFGQEVFSSTADHSESSAHDPGRLVSAPLSASPSLEH